ncbi:TPA: 1,4-dihydroxy-2-naphthoate polyprenyltransferase [Streptococcus suis]|uniref:1,4-dihydroxy-2-naphthoate polyprenyltransferase n=1 Tax=Streptococcus suis TaxID=1307 RepID=UPI0005CDC333|nr:1,4-dihydroxy-2-naphthoate polyprenyltransferase [Streptococcus suis]MDW8575548.1 1,4-dihydroxy-2-naphthoate polyprenyltransferase [Streptococcus suis]MDW8589485.1 1,4-dihydroxy-2-naphthoate polyprenyltransferase [Streptococcus suis]MDW8615473.1 1,4-dihydroxy-2-naphthoate polyprenyltransferase [Streptococcus suis]NQH06905.1 1,4-dihydroxy-2-naphthoate polyprenyltransferase [Streptococcus suis]NQH16436.1 1,4-dihydroxy-2-naphthoate polyprenyltransferase [Streptococcus suis]
MNKSTKGLSLPAFLEFVEMKTKVASVFPMTLGILWAIYRYQTFNWLNTLLFIIAVLSFDMCTTAINNSMDYHKAKDETYRQESNVIGKFSLDFRQMIGIVLALLIFSLLVSLLLVWRTSWLLLPMGALCFLIGIFYTFGPIPLSRMPLGEVFSGVTMGFGIFFLAVFIQDPAGLLTSQVSGQWMTLQFSWTKIIDIIVMSLPLVTLIANIMLANNTCDLEEDIRNHRYTLVYYIGKKNALKLYFVLASLPWLLWIIYCLTGFLPIWALIGLIGVWPAYKSLETFFKKQVKRETFIEAVKSFVLFALLYVVILALALIF